ncbi:beta-1,6-N-acetylglucosaminyltransferase [Leclercia pneumoniae]|uniref:beta-1,6-N-acetylglucosaminyltransferase n=1 Tax=Leclercia TaxID=83654 RepID=UPI0021E5F09B|nr:beta-1,6-N-acetylglucosaminyltransferase [Leclercia pneumoniae]MCV2510231.1 beta-1,6-N-acetylglucosaminyltransferase [Leclercia pneumoniae]WNN79783.1 beta-1,6-N-acetylglucosaminyltransferase [Leclercia pneumoniae]
MNTAVLIQAHKNEHFIRQLALSNKDVRFYVHMDAKFQSKQTWLKEQNISNLYLVENPVSVYWGGSSQIIATLRLMEIAFTDERNKFFHLISAECAPLKRFDEIENEWMRNVNRQFIESHRDPSNEWRLKVRIPHSNTKYLRTFLGRCVNKMYKFSTFFFDRVRFDQSSYYFGSQWFSVTREFVEEVIDKTNRSFFNSFNNITCADEHAFAIFARIKYSRRSTIEDNNKRYIEFKGKSSPEYLTEANVKELKSGANYWFCRKVHEQELLKLLYQESE